jgi:hypothetical protein
MEKIIPGTVGVDGGGFVTQGTAIRREKKAETSIVGALAVGKERRVTDHGSGGDGNAICTDERDAMSSQIKADLPAIVGVRRGAGIRPNPLD